jgi:Uma2 family endonuclease
MEVVSEGSVETDCVKKRALYTRTGAQEYWINDWRQQMIEVWTLTESPARAVSYSVGQTIRTPLLPDLAVHVDELLS